MPWTGGGPCPEVSASVAQPASVHVRRPAEKRLGRGAAPRSQPTPPTPSDWGAKRGERGPHRCCSAGRRRLRPERASLPLGCPGRSPRSAHHERRRSGLLGMAPQVAPGEKVEALCKYGSRDSGGSGGSASLSAGTSPGPARRWLQPAARGTG